MSTWTDKHQMGTVLFDFAATGQFQIALKQGEKVEVQKESSGWYKGVVVGRPEAKGIFPVSFIELNNDPLPPPSATSRATVAVKVPTVAPTPTPTVSPPGVTRTISTPPVKVGASNGVPPPPAKTTTPSTTGSSAVRASSPPPPPNRAVSTPGGATPSSPAVPPRATVAGPSATPDRPLPPPPVKKDSTPAAPAATETASATPSTTTSTTGDLGSPMNKPPPKKPPAVTVSGASSTGAPAALSSPTGARTAPPLPSAAKPPSTATSSTPSITPSSPTSTAKKEIKSPKAGAATGSGDILEGGEGTAIQTDITIEALHTEIAHTMADWSIGMKLSLQGGNMQEYQRGMERQGALLNLRRMFMDPSTPEDGREKLRLEIIHLIEKSRKMAEGYMVPRNRDGEVADPSNTGTIELLNLHRTMYKTLKEESFTDAKSAAASAAGVKKEAKEKIASSPSGVTKKVSWPAGHLQLFLDVKVCIFSVGEPTELFFSLYSNQNRRFITEDYQLSLTELGAPEDIKMLHKCWTLFKDLDAKDLDTDVYLVCKIYRRGKVVYDPAPAKKKSTTRGYRRPFGFAACSLTQAGLDSMLGKEYQPPNTAMTIYTPPSEEKFPKMHELIINEKERKTLEQAPRAKGIALGLTLYAGDVEVLRRELGDKLNPTEVPITNKLDFPEIMNPGEIRNDFYIFLLSGSFLQDNKKSAKNIEVLVQVLKNDGTIVPNCILKGGGDRDSVAEYRTTVYYHNNSPNYGEAIRLKIAPDMLEQCHLLFTFWHVSTSATKLKTSPFAFGWLPLTTDTGAVIPDEEVKIPSYKPFPKIETSSSGSFYLRPITDSKMALAPRKNEFFTVRTRLCSNKKTQNATLHALFKWRSLDFNTIKASLDKFCAINRGPGVNELAKFVRETFDVFFAILASSAHSSTHEHCFKALVHMLSLLTDKKLPQFRPLVDTYVNKLFDDSKAHSTLIRLCRSRLETCLKTPDASLVSLAKCLAYVLKFVVQSRHKDSASVDSTAFKKDLLSIFGMINQLAAVEMKQNTNTTSGTTATATTNGTADDKPPSAPTPLKSQDLAAARASSVVPGSENKGGDSKQSAAEKISEANIFSAQSYLVRSFPAIIKDITGLFDSTELGTMARDLLVAIPAAANQNVNKLNLIRHLLDGPVGEALESRNILFPVALHTLRSHLRYIDQGQLSEPYLCLSILMKMLTIMQTKANFDSAKMNDFHALTDAVVNVALKCQQSHVGDIVLKPPSDTVLQSCQVDTLVDSATVFWALIYTMTDEQMDNYIKGLNGENFKQFSSDVLTVCTNVLDLNIYPDMWIMMNTLQLSVISKLLERLPLALKVRCLRGNDFTLDIWIKYFLLCLAMLQCDGLALDKFTKQKRDFIVSRVGDLRTKVVLMFRDMWFALDGKQKSHFTEVLVAKLFGLAMKFEGESRKLALDLYFDMAQTEFKESKDFNVVERHTIDALYDIANLSQEGGQTFMDIYVSSMKERFEAGTNTALKTAGHEFLAHIHRMYALMAALLKFPDTALYEDERTTVALKLMTYLESSGHVRKEMYTRYVQYLVDLHAGLKNYVEAGVTQMFQIRALEFSDEILSKTHVYPEEKERDRREKLYRSAIEYFKLGEDWERAIERCEELRQYYQHSIYDYDKLAGVLKEEADYFKTIRHGQRFYPAYFRVCFHGAFDDEIKEKEFVYRGVKLEPVMDFTNRIKKKYPEAEILKSSDAPSDEMRAQFKQIISITTLVKPSEQQRLELTGVNGAGDAKNPENRPGSRPPPLPIQKYREENNLKVFVYSKAIQKSPDKKPANEHKHLWVTKTYIFCPEPFPSNRRRMEVVSRTEQVITPVDSAVQTLIAKTQELTAKIDEVDNAPPGPVDVGPLSMILNGMIDAAVSGGTQKYIEAFLGADFLVENPTMAASQAEMKQVLREQVVVLKRGLDVFGVRSDQKLKGLFDHLTAFYAQMLAKTTSVTS